MAGHIRAKGKCPMCGVAFTEIPKIGFLCLEHQTVPKRLYVDLPWKGERIRIFSDKTGQVLDTYDRADRIRERIEGEIEDHAFDPAKYITAEASKFWTANLLDRFERDKIEIIAPAYKKDYRRMVRIAKGFFGNEDARELRKIHLINYMKHCREQFPAWKGKTLKNNMDLFKVFMNYLKNDLEIIERVPKFPDIDVAQPPIRWVDAKDQVLLYELVPDADKPIVGFLMLHGCRPGEARAIKCKDVDLEDQFVTIHATFSKNVYREKRKGQKSKPYTVAIHHETIEFILDRVRTSHPEAFVFSNPRTGRAYTQESLKAVWDKVRAGAGITNGLRLYDATRHSLASQLANQNVSIQKISRLLGHSTTRMSERYTHHDLESLRADLSLMSLKRKETVTTLSLRKKDDEK